MKINNENIWITSDTHYNHKNICRGVTEWRTKEGDIPNLQTRDFPTIARMNYAIMSGINDVVGQDDGQCPAAHPQQGPGVDRN